MKNKLLQINEEEKEILDLGSIIEIMRECSEKYYILTYEREKFITMVKTYIDHLKVLDKVIHKNGKD